MTAKPKADVAVNDFVRRQTAESRFSHYDGTIEEVARLAALHFYHPCVRQGYRDGVVEVDVPPQGFYTSIVQLEPGMRFVGKYEARQEGEEPRRHIDVVGGHKMPAVAVTLILYRHDVLAENDEQTTDAEWELISINARPTREPQPMKPGTLMANHFQQSGGTATNMTDAEFVAALRESVEYWKDKALAAPSQETSTVTEPGWYWARYMLTNRLGGTVTDEWGMIHIVDDGGVLCFEGTMDMEPTPIGGSESVYRFIGPVEPPK